MLRAPAVVLAVALACGSVAPACGGSGMEVGRETEPGVAFLGGREVTFRADRDVLHVGQRMGRFSAIRIEVPDASLEMYDIRVTFGDGQIFSPETRVQFHAGDQSRRIDLPGGARIIRSIEFFYRSDSPAEGRAHVRVYGVR
ncbi:MAG: hypothetical protein U1F43_23130 [Myxococcota bacterium]